MNFGKHVLGRLCAAGLVVVLMGTCVGCGSGGGLVAVEGNVTFDGQPVEEGSIAFEPADGAGPSAGGTIQQGKYALAADAGVLPGKKTVRITAVRKTGKQVAGGLSGDSETMVDVVEKYIPAIYNEKSTLTCEVVAGSVNQHNFDLKSE